MEKENYLMYGQASQDSSYWMKRNLMDTHGAGWDLQEIKKTSRLDDICPEMRTRVSDAAKKKAKQRWTIEKSKFDNARQLKGIFFIQTMKKSSSQSKPLEESLKFRCQQQCRAKYQERAVGRPTAILGNTRQDFLLMPTRAQDQGSKELYTSLIRELFLCSPIFQVSACVVFVCANMCFRFSRCNLWDATLFHVRLGLPMEALLDPSRWVIQESLHGRRGLHQRCTFWHRSGWRGVEVCFFVTLGA